MYSPINTFSEKDTYEKDRWLIDLYYNVVRKLKDNKILWDKGSLLLANEKATILHVESTKDFPVSQILSNIDFSVEAVGKNAIGITAKTGEKATILGKEHDLDLLHSYTSVSVPFFNNENKLIGVIGYLTDLADQDIAEGKLQELLTMFSLALDNYQELKKLKKENLKKDDLLSFSRRLNSIFDVNDVLLEAIKIMNLLYPKDQLEFLMTHDYFVQDASIKQFAFIPNSNNIKSKAFLQGRLFVERRKGNEIYELAVPLKGKQGVYGIIHLICHDNVQTYDSEKVDYVSTIADIISRALEKANLYHQSIVSIKELQIINELTKRLNQSLDKDEILHFIINESLKLFAAENVSILKLDETSRLLKIIASHDKSNIGNSILSDYGYMGLVYKNNEPIIFSDLRNDTSVHDIFVENNNFRSLISVPINVNKNFIGILSVYSIKPYHFSYKDFQRLQLFSQHIGLTLTNVFFHERLHQMAITDYLTGLFNRSYLDKQIEISRKKDKFGSLLLFDIDDFKKINDKYGHQVGDQVLIQVANIIRESIREEDVAARWGGEEIAVYLPNLDSEISESIATRILKYIRDKINPSITISCGTSTWISDLSNKDFIKLVKEADQALYEAKKNGKDQVIIFNR